MNEASNKTFPQQDSTANNPMFQPNTNLYTLFITTVQTFSENYNSRRSRSGSSVLCVPVVELFALYNARYTHLQCDPVDTAGTEGKTRGQLLGLVRKQESHPLGVSSDKRIQECAQR